MKEYRRSRSAVIWLGCAMFHRVACALYRLDSRSAVHTRHFLAPISLSGRTLKLDTVEPATYMSLTNGQPST